MKTIREIVTNLNVARSNNCSKEKSEEIKEIINDLLPHEKSEKALEIIKNKCEIELDKECGVYYLNIVCDYGYDLSAVCIKVSKEEYDLLQGVFGCEPK